MAINIEFEGEWSDHYKKLSEEFDIELVVPRRLANGESINDIRSSIAGPKSFFFFQNKMMVRSVDEMHYEIYFTTGGTTIKKYEGFEKEWLLMIANQEFEKFIFRM